MRSNIQTGFSLIELMIVIAIIAVLSLIAVPNLMRSVYRARRAEVYAYLGSLYVAQKAYWAEHGYYAKALTGPEGLNWKPDGYRGGGAQEQFYYTYGFGTGTEGSHFVTGKCGTAARGLTMTKADQQGFVMGAIADIDGDGKPDIITIDQDNRITIVEDDLA